MYFLLYRHTDDGVFDDFPKISIPATFRRFPKILQKLSEDHEGHEAHEAHEAHEECRNIFLK